MTRLSRIRRRQWRKQGELCCYCFQPTWDREREAFAKSTNLTARQVCWLQATLEHLHARCDGGSNRRSNLAVACRYCNLHRHQRQHPLPPPEYRRMVSERMAAGKWHGLRVSLQPNLGLLH